MLFYVLIIFCLILIYTKFKSNSHFWINKNVASESGTLWKFMTGNCSLPEIYKSIYDKYQEEPHVGIFLSLKPALLIRDLENVKAVLTSDFQSFSSRDSYRNPRDILADNVLLMDHYPRWKLMRHKLTPVFTGASLKKMFNNLDRCAQDLVVMMDNDPEMRGKPFNAMYTYSTTSIGASFFGIDIQVSNTMKSPYLNMSWETLKTSTSTNIKFYLRNTLPVTLFKLLNIKLFGRFEIFFINAIKEVLKLRRLCGENNNDFIDLSLELQNTGTMRDTVTNYEIEPTDEVFAAQAFLFFIAGTDTTANTMHFTMLELSNNPDILNKVHEEIDRVFAECNDNVTYDEIVKLTYLDQVIKEALRKYPPIGRIQRKCTKNTILPVGNIKIEKGVLIIVPTFALHRDEKYFPNPEKFDPGRFSPENMPTIKKYTYLPFGEGYRNCIGLRFARLQVMAGLARLLRKYSLKSQNYIPAQFEKNFFNIRLPNSNYELFKRESI